MIIIKYIYRQKVTNNVYSYHIYVFHNTCTTSYLEKMNQLLIDIPNESNWCLK